MSFVGLLNHRVDLINVVNTQNSTTGSRTDTSTPTRRNVMCRMRTLSAREQVAIGAENVVSTHRFMFMPDVPITAAYRIKWLVDLYKVNTVVPHYMGSVLHHNEVDATLVT